MEHFAKLVTGDVVTHYYSVSESSEVEGMWLAHDTDTTGAMPESTSLAYTSREAAIEAVSRWATRDWLDDLAGRRASRIAY